MPRRKTHEEYVKGVAEINPDIEVVDRYINDNTKIKHRCKRDGYEWYAKPNHILQGRGCPKCCNHIPYTLESFKSALFVVNNAMEVIDEKYINNKTPILVKCKIDGHIWRTTPNALLKGANCPVCAGKTISKISNLLCVAKPTIARWLKTATSFGWCNYIPKNKTRTIYCVELNKIFNSIKSASDELGIWETSIINCLRGRWKYTIVPNTKEKLHWLYIEDMINI